MEENIQQPEVDIRSLIERIEKLEKCCKKFKTFMLGDMVNYIRNDSKRGEYDFRYLNLYLI